MSPTDYFRLFVLWLWLLDSDVKCKGLMKDYVVRVQAGQAPMGVHDDDKRWRETSIFRIPAAGYKTSSVDGGRSSSIYPAQEDHIAYSKSSQIQSHYPVIPETQDGNVPKSHVGHFKSGFNSALLTQRRSAVLYTRSGNKAFPDGKEIHQANSDPLFSTDAVQVPSRIYSARTKLTRGFSAVQVDNAAVGFGQNNRKGVIYLHSNPASPNIQDIKSSLKSESKINVNPSRPNVHPRPKMSEDQPAYVFHNSINRDRHKLLQKVLKPVNEMTDSIVKGHSDKQMSSPTWSPRGYNSDVMPEPRGYTHVRHIRPQASSAAGRKFLETGFPSGCCDSTKLGFGLGVPSSSERQLNPYYNSKGSQPDGRRPPPRHRAPTPVQGKFKPFQRRPTNDDLHVHTHSSDSETAPTQTSAGTTLPPNLNSTGITSSVVPSVSGELSTKSAAPMQTEGQDAELVTRASNHEGQSEDSAEVGPSLEQTTVSPRSYNQQNKKETVTGLSQVLQKRISLKFNFT